MSVADVNAGSTVDFREDLAAMVTAFPAAMRDLQRTLFVLHVAATVRHSSSLIGVAAEVDGIDFHAAARRIGPPRHWPEHPLPEATRHLRHYVDRRFRFTPDQIIRRHRRAGSIAAASAISDDMIGIRVAGDGIEMTAVDGRLRVETFRGLARLVVDGALPAVVADGVRGRRIGEVVSHRWLDGREWPIVAVDDAGDDRTSIYFGTGNDCWVHPRDEVIGILGVWGSPR